MKRPLLAALGVVVLGVVLPQAGCARPTPERLLPTLPTNPYAIVKRMSHDRTLFTQGLLIDRGKLIESGGNYGESRLLLRTLADPRPLRTHRLPVRWFAEGIAVHDGKLHLLTWREGVMQRFSLPELEPEQRFDYRGEGWGLASDGTHLIQSDGSATLRWRSPAEFSEWRRLTVRVGKQPLERLNELEWVNGWLLANVWLTDSVVAIDPRNGCARWRLELGELLDASERRSTDVLNGIAWDADTGLLWVTGKLWPWLFALRIEPPPLPTQTAPGGSCT
ncbi:MAG: glutaminyl-peptide cyclotransferase [Pseudomonadales bacterium]|jgi:glutamine cyclotransferase|nr:glutaminyl-peptide cyclotransferase [Pseudomonadales bacterium]MCP5320603.1 glutaminyl-peptide cyclotransferase [Pseudomonadales bacterium]MCP5336652.1 glutaminyl-peptide cyclotransferase [Pseudomonadales bacterium]